MIIQGQIISVDHHDHSILILGINNSDPQIKIVVNNFDEFDVSVNDSIPELKITKEVKNNDFSVVFYIDIIRIKKAGML